MSETKATKGQAKACYDNYFGVLRCLNGGTREENERSAPACRAELEKYVAVAKALASNPSKVLAQDAWYMRALTEDIPANFAAFCGRYPAQASMTTPTKAGPAQTSAGEYTPGPGQTTEDELMAICRELASFQFTTIAEQQGGEFALLQLCKIKRKARLAIARAEGQAP